VRLDREGLIGVVAFLSKGHYRLGQDELQGYLILFDPHAQTHDRENRLDCLLSQWVVPYGSSHITASHKVRTVITGLISETVNVPCLLAEAVICDDP